MQTLRKLVTLTLFFALATHSIYGQPSYNQEYEYDDYNDSAYMQSSYTAHWSAYIPIAALLAAGIFWAVADKKHSSSSSHSSPVSYKGLGRLDSYSSYHSDACSSYSTSYSMRSSYSH